MTYVRELLKFRKPATLNVGKDVVDLEFSHPTSANVKWK